MSIFYNLFFLVIFLIFFKLFQNRNFLKFLFSIFGLMYKENEKIIETTRFYSLSFDDTEFSKEEVFALSIGDLEHERMRNEIEETTLMEYLKNEYNREFSGESLKNDTVYILQMLWSEGSMALFWNHTKSFRIEVRDIIAFDAVRFTEFIRQLLYLELLEEEVAWGWLFLNAQRVQDSYLDGKDFQRAYFKGLTLHKYSKQEEKKQELFEFESEFYRAMNSSKVKIEWLEEELFSHFESVKN